ncbi:MAG: ATP-binding cassette domain-containing protein, partial [Eubacterium sp.]
YMRLQIEQVSHCYSKNADWVLKEACLTLKENRTVGLLGTSGSGKSTLGQIAAGLFKPVKGQVLCDGKPFEALPKKDERRLKIQMIFQHPEVSFNPQKTLAKSLAEIYKLCGKTYSEAGLYEMAAEFGIYKEQLQRVPAKLSGGELQRLSIARALLSEPDILILDEPTSMLDVISQAQIMRMLMEWQEKKSLTYLFITHDVALCRYVSDEIYTIEKGVINKTNALL